MIYPDSAGHPPRAFGATLPLEGAGNSVAFPAREQFVPAAARQATRLSFRGLRSKNPEPRDTGGATLPLEGEGDGVALWQGAVCIAAACRPSGG